MSISIDQLPRVAAGAGIAFRDRLLDELGEDLVALWVDGGTTFADRPRVTGDLDVCAVLHDMPPSTADPKPQRRRIRAAAAAVQAAHGVHLDTRVLLASQINQGHPVSRAHWLAGQYVHLHGRDPEQMVTAPSWAELKRALDRELEHLERHVYEGDATNPYEATYAVFNGSRILYTLDTGSPVISKRSAGAWGLEHLPEIWHEAIRAAARSYDGQASAADNELLQKTMPPFVEMVRQQLPPTEPRPPGPPRWGGE